MSCFDRAFQMLCTMQPKRKRKCMLQDALRCTRRRRGREADSVPLPSPWTKVPNCNAWLGHLAPVHSIATDTGQRNHPWKNTQMHCDLWGGKAAVARLWPHPLHAWCVPHLAPSHPGPPGRREMERISCLAAARAGALGRKVGGLLSAFHPCSSPAQLEGTAPSPAAGGTEQGAALGFFLWFVCLVLLGVEQRWKKVRFPVPLPKM